MTDSTKTESKRFILSGVPASPGYSISQVRKIEEIVQSFSDEPLGEDRASYEIAALNKAISKAILEIRELKEQMSAGQLIQDEELQIFDTHLMMLEDPLLLDSSFEQIRETFVSAEYAYHFQINALIESFEKRPTAINHEKIDDLRDICQRVLNHLNTNAQELNFPTTNVDCIFVTHGLTPSQVVQLRSNHTLGLATDTGGATSHFSIIARSMEIPAVAGLKNISLLVEDGDTIILDGNAGIVIVHPTDEDIKKYREKKLALDRKKEDLEGLRQKKPITLDGHLIELKANIELPIEVSAVISNGADGVGLFRSEFLYFHSELPTEEEQLKQYQLLLEKAAPLPVIIRTLDAGGDKLVKNLSLSDELNPFMGWRSIRVCLQNIELFKTQLRALLKANTRGNLRLMFPMICSLSELRDAKLILEEVKEELREQKKLPEFEVPLGIMIEIPSILFQIDLFAHEVDFFSIGTNDLVQFTLAVDRSNEKVAYLYQPHHPAILKIISVVVEAAKKVNIPVSICGEMASDPFSIILLAGLGIKELSMSSWTIPANKKFIRSLSMEEMEICAESCLAMETPEQVNAFLYHRFISRVLEAGASSTLSFNQN